MSRVLVGITAAVGSDDRFLTVLRQPGADRGRDDRAAVRCKAGSYGQIEGLHDRCIQPGGDRYAHPRSIPDVHDLYTRVGMGPGDGVSPSISNAHAQAGGGRPGAQPAALGLAPAQGKSVHRAGVPNRPSERYLGQRLTQAAVSAIERAWDGERRREFDAHELLIFAMVFDLPIIWFLLPPPGDRQLMRAEKITGSPSSARRWSYKERRKELLLALLDDHADSLDSAVDELGRWVDHLRQVGIRGFIAEHTNDADFARAGQDADEAPARGSEDEAARHERSRGRRPTTSTSRRERNP